MFFRDSTRKQGSLPFGAKKESAADIIAKSKREREERAKKKKEEESALKIQAACRSYVARKRQQAEWLQHYEADQQSLDIVARMRLFLALRSPARQSLLATCVATLQQQWSAYQTALHDSPATRVYQARHLSKVILDALKSRDSLPNHVIGQLIALVDQLVRQEQERVARWLIDRAELFRTIHELCDRYSDHVTALIDLAAHSYLVSASDVAVSAQLWWHLLSSEHVNDTHVTHLTAAVTHALSVLTRDQSRGVDFVTLFRTHKLDLDTRGLRNAARNGAIILRALVEDTEHESRDQFAHWMAVIEQCAAHAQHHAAVAQRATLVRAVDEEDDAMEIEFTEPQVPPRDYLTEQTAAQICTALLTERARDHCTVLAVLARTVSAATLDWHFATLSRLVAHLLTHGTAHDTRRVCAEISEAYTRQWPALRQSDEFRRLLRDLTGQAVEHTATSTSVSTELLLHTWLTLTVTHALLARVDRSGLSVDIPHPLLTITRELCASFQDKLVRLYWREDSAESAAFVLLRRGVTQLLSLAHELSAVHAGVWPKHSALSAAQVQVLLEAYPSSFKRVMRHAPFLLDTKEKVVLLQQWIRADKEVYQPVEQGQISHIQIRRTHLLQDVYLKLAPPGTSLKRTVKIEFINQAGLQEAGIDGGGLFRELVNEVIKTAFSPQYGLFKATEQQQLYPNPASALLVENDTDKFRFLGRLLGKCIYELCLVDLPFTEFFLAQLLDRPVAMHQLKSLDAALYKGLLSLRSYTGDFEDLELTFSVHEDARDIETAAVNLPRPLTAGRVVELIDQGNNVKVTRDNVEEYIALVAKYRMQTQISAQSRAFKEGLCEVIDREWLALLGWTESEFALLINGEQLVHGLDIAAMQEHVVYAGGYHAHHPVVLLFWEVLSEFTPEQQSMLLKYATSSPRPPLLGFGALQPKFCIKLSSQDESYLPSANTCMNLLKLPAYHSKQLMRDKLLYAINSNSGFDLS